MSLINEALKRARHEAARQDAERAGLPYPTLPFHMRPPRRRRWAWAAGLVAAVALGAATFLLTRSRAPEILDAAPPAAAANETAADRPVGEAVAVGPREGGDPEPRPAAETAGASLGAAASDPLPTTAAATAEGAASSGGGAGPRPEIRTPRRPPAPAANPPSPAAGRSFVRTAVLPTGGTLELSGIAWSSTRPVAVINGQVVAAGESIEGHTVVRIEPEAVELQSDSGTISINLR